MMEIIFWLAFLGVVYAYFGYAILLALIAKIRARKIQYSAIDAEPPYRVTVLIPAYNEAAVIKDKLINTLDLDYPADKLEIVVVSDGSSDGTDDIVKEFTKDQPVSFYRVEDRKGKANALNTGLNHAKGDIIVFSDSSIMLEKNALIEITRAFADPDVGCVSGEDIIPGGGGEGLYGRYELYLRNLESRVGSIVGASGSFYAQRNHLCLPFVEGLAPDFLSVLNTVEKDYRAISETSARGTMSAVDDTGAEFRRKVRTLLRGMSTLWDKRNLLNPARFGMFAFVLFSHKLMRWLVPFLLLAMLVSNLFLLDSGFYVFVFLCQLGFYVLAYFAWKNIANLNKQIIGKIALYFTVVNVAILQAWVLFIKGARQEIWEPSKRS